ADAIAPHPPASVLFPRAIGGREELPERLRARGFEVEVADAYETIRDDEVITRIAAEHRAAPFAAIAFASPKGVAAILDAGLSLGGVLVGAIGRTTAAALS